MKLSRFFSIGLLLAGLASQMQASGQTVVSPYSPYRASSPPVSVYPAPNAPCLPGSRIPGTVYPGTVLPGTPVPGSPTPGTPTPGTPTPGTPTPTPGTDPGSMGGGGTTPTTPGMGSGADGFSGATAAGGSGAVASAAPGMIGDLHAAYFARQRGVSPGARAPVPQVGGFKISENESPRPVDRIFFTYNYFNNVNTYGGSTYDLHREVFGFEKTFLDGNASFGMRVPLLQKNGLDGASIDGFGDLTFITKYAFLNDCQTGNIFSGGLAVTAPTGRTVRSIFVDGGDLNTWLIQPWTGFIFNADDAFVQGFTSVVVPTDSSLPAFAAIDLGVGYKVWQSCSADSILTSITPTLEYHATIPLNHFGIENNDVGLPYIHVVTAGVHFGICGQSTFTLGAATPIGGPQPFNYEGIAQFNLRF